VSQAHAIATEVGHQLRVFRRTPISAFFTVGFPVFFFLIFNLLQGNEVIAGTGIRFAQFFTPSIAVFAMVTAAYTNIAIGVSIDRDEGLLKRVRGTPLAPAAYLTARIVASTLVGALSVLFMFVVGMIGFDVQPLWARLPVALLVLVLGAACFSALGVAVAGAAPNAQAAPVIANITILPLLFVSGVFFPVSGGPGWLTTLADLLPLKPMTDAFRAQWDPTVPAAFPLRELGVMAAWSIIGVVVATRTFSWDPRPGGRSRGRSDSE